MGRETVCISRAVEMLEDNLMKVARVIEWADLMGYKSPKRFSRKFLRHHEVRPQRVLEFVRLKSITCDLRNNNASNFEIARAHDIPDEKALNKFTNYHLGCSPTDLKMMSEYQLEKTLERLDSKIR
jgi:methylphosphotriester-DNA--protein-cysteine methyltransferase